MLNLDPHQEEVDLANNDVLEVVSGRIEASSQLGDLQTRAREQKPLTWTCCIQTRYASSPQFLLPF